MAFEQPTLASQTHFVEKPEEDSTLLIFPPGKGLFNKIEFEDSDTLLISEVFMLLQHRRKAGIESGEIDSSEIPEVFSKTYKYTEIFNRYKSIESISVARNILSKSFTKLHPFETAALANLCPSLAEEAKKLIPSLRNKIEDEELQEILDEVRPYVYNID
ncbi:hypothetical protein HZS_2660 [Henneguya salminicola]|nr:hypothetical protein HZS_2660 [Henneguya salminicola]